MSASSFFTFIFALFFLTSFKKPLAQILLIILALSAFGYYLKYKPSLSLTRAYKWLAWVWVLMFASVLPNLFMDGSLEHFSYNLRLLNMPLIYLLGVLALVCLSNAPITLNERVIFYSMAVACVCNGMIALVQRLGFRVARVDAWSTIVGFVTLTSIAVLGCYIYALYTSKRHERAFFSVALGLGFIVVLFSATRSAWIAFTLTFIMLSGLVLYLQKSWHSLPYMLSMSAVLIGLFVGGQILESKALIKTSRGAKESFSHDLKLYAQKSSDSSIGARLERWKEALVIVRLSPFFGMSLSARCKHMSEIVAMAHSYHSVEESDCKGKYDNEIFNVLAHKGLIGLGILLTLWVVVAHIFIKRLESHPQLSLLMLSLLGFYIILGIGFDPFAFFIEGSFFVGMLVMGMLGAHPKQVV
ncbi:O-antigen ligase family protein [Helicobacter baculiformis]|uniref:O-antigen ligase family protein n=1 Tax=Helicobacter baculiformis TaxID=427351 RepID=A0ABV7ZH14_9HELI|nr:O-antigen ligase family protein [Helicobacter baculiformis]